MKEKESDIFELTKALKNIESMKESHPSDDNPFNNFSKPENVRHLNDYDFNILKNGAYKDIEDDTLKLEYKISRTEEEIKNIESQISTAQEINDSESIAVLTNKLNSINNEYQALLALYNNKTVSAKITDCFSNLISKAFGKNLPKIQSNLSNICESMIDGMPKQISSIFKIRKSLSVLENINKSVDELVTMTVPYGENTDRYKQLSKYILKANSIQSEISGYLKKSV